MHMLGQAEHSWLSAGKVAVALGADDSDSSSECQISRVSHSSCTSDASLRENSAEARHIVNRTDGAFAEALACEVLLKATRFDPEPS
jgi:hypothetical protein